MRLIARVALVALLVASCGASDAVSPPAASLAPDVSISTGPTESSDVPVDVETTEQAESSTTSTTIVVDVPNYVMSTGLVCPNGSNSMVYDYVDGADGAATLQAAADAFGFPDGGPFDRGPRQVVADVDTGQIDMLDGNGTVRAILRARDDGNGWLIETSEVCLEP